MCLTPLHCVNKKPSGFHPVILLLHSCHDQSYWILSHWSHPLLSPVWLLPWNYILPDTVKHTSYLNPGVLASPSLSLTFHLPLCTSAFLGFLSFYQAFNMLFNTSPSFSFPLSTKDRKTPSSAYAFSPSASVPIFTVIFAFTFSPVYSPITELFSAV